MSLLGRLGLDDLRPRREDVARLAVLIVTCLVTALLVLDWSRAPTERVREGEVATRTVKAPFTFHYLDADARADAEDEARRAVPPVFLHEPRLAEQIEQRVREGFARARSELSARGPADEDTDPVARAASLSHDDRQAVAAEFRTAVGVHLPEDEVTALLDAGFPEAAELLAVRLLDRAMRGYVVADRQTMPHNHGTIRVVRAEGGSDRIEIDLRNHEGVRTPVEARQIVSIALLEAQPEPAPWVSAAAAIARASVRPNLTYDEIRTADQRDRAAASVPIDLVTVKRGTTLFREGDVLSAADVLRYRELQASRAQHGLWIELAAVGMFLLLLLASLYHFGASYLADFSTRLRDIVAAASLLALVAALARVVVAAADPLAEVLGRQAVPESVWFLVPVAGAAMLVRVLLGIAWTVVFSVAAATVCGIVMDLQALTVVFFVLSSIVGAGAVEHTQERLAVLRAGLFTAVVNAAAVLLIHFLQRYLAEGMVTLAPTLLWSMAFAALGGMLSAILALGLVPVFETFGFVTDYRLMELANLNHPLLRQLMLRAPGTYHHSVIVGTLAEAACQQIGANALQARVCAYFHDIGKSLKPQYFVENQRDGHNRHATLDPRTSAQIIIRHVVDGGRMAREHNLPKPIVDNIHMHHGTGLLQYFLSCARAGAEDPSTVLEADFRYPGPKPDTKEAGIIMLADKVEAATRTLRQPSEDGFRAMIGRIVSSVMADGQFERCPLTFQEIHTIADTFVTVLVGIYHQRIEYADTRHISRGDHPGALSPEEREAAGIITLELHPTPAPRAPRAAGPPGEAHPGPGDYEAVDHLPHGGSHGGSR